MSNVFTSIFNNDACIEGVRSLFAAHGAGRHQSILNNTQSRAARCAARCEENWAVGQEVTPFDFNISWNLVSPSSDVLFCNCETDL